MKKKWSLIAAAAAALALAGCMLAGCGSNDAAKDSANSDTTKLIVGFDQSYPPYGFVGDDGNYTGFDLDLATEVANRNGWDIQLEAIDWDAKDTLLNSGAINCIWNGFTMEGREDDYTFTDPYMLNAQVVVVKSSSGIKSLDDLAGKNVITQTDSAAQEVLEAIRPTSPRNSRSSRPLVITTPHSCSSSRVPSMLSLATCPSPSTRCPRSPACTPSFPMSFPASTTPSA